MTPKKNRILGFQNKIVALRNQIFAIASASVIQHNFFKGEYLIKVDQITGEKEFYCILFASLN